ncbi:MAG: Uma2 family endonuclease [Cytophagales bacterium]|nr:Uma2 family endonuclease [Cytophagales bacterium]
MSIFLEKIIYPETDGEPMAENTLQFEWIVTIKEGIETVFAENPDVFVAGDLFWYPAEGHIEIRYAPDIMVAFGRPKGHRRSYLQWLEGNVPPQVVFEILSHSNRVGEMMRKFEFYQRHGVEEYYVYDPQTNRLEGWQRNESLLVPIESVGDWVSPMLGIRFALTTDTLEIHRPDGTRFQTYQQLATEKKQADQRAASAEKQLKASEEKARRLAEKLKELGIDPDQIA